MYDIQKIGEIVAQRRRELHMTQETLASELHISAQAVSKWENGVGYPDLTLLPDISRVLKLPIEMLFGAVEQKSGDRGRSSSPFPQTFEKLTKVWENGRQALYSDKHVISQDDSRITFSDGSYAELETQTVVNMGAGEARFVTRELRDEWDDWGEDLGPESREPRQLTSDVVNSLDMALGWPCSVSVRRGETAETRVRATGSSRFLAKLKMEVHGRILHLAVEHHGNMDDSSGEKDNRIDIETGFDRGGSIRLAVNGSSDVESLIDFEAGNVRINGCGDVTLTRVTQSEVFINGCGDVKMGDGVDAQISINGSGDYQVGNLKTLIAKINGSGEVSAESVSMRTDLRISGSGDMNCQRLSGTLDVGITGSGSLVVGGEVSQLSLRLAGSAGVDGKSLVTKDAEIVTSDGMTGEIIIGRIRGQSLEKLCRTCRLTVLQRG